MGASVRRHTFSSAQKPLVSVLTPTVPGREGMLEECEITVAGQTLCNHEHLILLDDEYRGCAPTMNDLAGHALGEWLFILADDDLLLPRCLELLVAHGSGQIIYAPPLVWGEDHEQFRASPPNIPAPALIRKDFWDLLGGYDVLLQRTEDRDFWCRAGARGASFVRVSEHPTWVYRFWGGNKSR